MAHILKVKQSGVGQLVAHNRRLREVGHYGNERIDPERTSLNYRIGGVDDVTAELARAAKRTPRGRLNKNQVAMFVVANTLPRDWPEGRDPREYFELCHTFNRRLFPTAVSLGMDVHYDETTEHGHDGYLPTTEDGRFNYDTVVPRRVYQTYHRELQKFLEQETGLHLQVLLDKDNPDRALSGVSQDRLDEAKAAVTSELDKARREATESAQKAEKAADRANARADKARRSARLLEGENYVSVAKDGTRTNRRGVAGLRKDIAELESRRDELAAEVDALVAEGVSHREELRAAEVEHAARLEGLQQAEDSVAAEVAELEGQARDAGERVAGLESVVAEARSFESAPRSGKVAILDRIAAGCDRLRASFDARSDWLRARADRVEGIIDRIRSGINRLTSINRERGINRAGVAHQRTGRVADELVAAQAASDALRGRSRGGSSLVR